MTKKLLETNEINTEIDAKELFVSRNDEILNKLVERLNEIETRLDRLVSDDDNTEEVDQLRFETQYVKGEIVSRAFTLYMALIEQLTPGYHGAFTQIIENAGSLHNSAEGLNNPFATELFASLFKQIISQVVPSIGETSRSEIEEIIKGSTNNNSARIHYILSHETLEGLRQ